MKTKSLIFVILAGLLWGTSGIFVNFLAPYGFTSIQMTSVRAAISFICILAFVLIRDKSLLKINLIQLLICCGAGGSLFATAALYYTAMQMTSVSTAVVLMYTSPIYVVVLAVFFLGEKISRLKLISIAGMILGCIFVSGVLDSGNFNAPGIAISLISGLAYSLYNLLTKIAVKANLKPTTTTLYSFMFMTLIALVISKPWQIVTYAAVEPLKTVPLLIGLATFTFVIPYTLYTIAMKSLSAGTASSLSIVEPASATVYSILFFDEKLTAFAIIGTALILLSTITISKAEQNTK